MAGNTSATNSNNNNGNNNNQTNKPQDRKREFLLNKNVSAESVQNIIEGINEINRYDVEQESKDSDYIRKPIKVIVDSYGGSIYCGLALVNTIDTSETPIHTYCFGKAMSMGFAIFNAGHKRFAHKNAYFMYHDAGTTERDTIEGIQQSIDQIKKVVKALDEMIVEYTDIPMATLNRYKKRKENWYMNGVEAMELGLVDELVMSTRSKHRKAS